jgi:hypothetical protein
MQIMGRSTIANVSLTTAGTEYSYTIPVGTKRIKFKLRALNALLKYSFTSGESGTTYITVAYGDDEEINDAKLGGQIIYFQSPTASQVVEVRTWK